MPVPSAGDDLPTRRTLLLGSDGRIEAIGFDSVIRAGYDADSFDRVIDAEGKCILPGKHLVWIESFFSQNFSSLWLIKSVFCTTTKQDPKRITGNERINFSFSVFALPFQNEW